MKVSYNYRKLTQLALVALVATGINLIFSCAQENDLRSSHVLADASVLTSEEDVSLNAIGDNAIGDPTWIKEGAAIPLRCSFNTESSFGIEQDFLFSKDPSLKNASLQIFSHSARNSKKRYQIIGKENDISRQNFNLKYIVDPTGNLVLNLCNGLTKKVDANNNEMLRMSCYDNSILNTRAIFTEYHNIDSDGNKTIIAVEAIYELTININHFSKRKINCFAN